MRRINISNIKQLVIRLLSVIIPEGKIVVFRSSPDYADNPYALYKSMLNHPAFAGYRFVWFVDNRDDRKLISDIKADNPAVIIPDNAIEEWWYLLRATFLVYSHSFYDSYHFRNRRKRINLWHGTGFKKVGIDNNETPVNTDILVTTNTTWQRYLAHSFNLPVHNVWVTGEPRTDLMFTPTDFFRKMNIDTTAYKSIGIWLPTFRKHILLDTQEGQYDKSKLAGFSMDDLADLDAFLKQIQGLLIIKLHMYDKLQELDFPAFENIVIVKPKDFHDQLYPLLGSTDYLITDYSSVSFDYDILNRPMAFVLNDMRAYVDHRGFYEPDIEDRLPGKIVNTMDDLKEFVSNPDKYRIDTLNRFNDYKDANACNRVIDRLLSIKS